MTPIYLMPGMAAGPKIFEYISLPEEDYSLHFLSWKIPEPDESLQSYAKKMLKEIRHDNPVLIGVSFGGILVQEMSRYISCKKLIIVSSVKTKYEMPRRMRYSRHLGLYRLAPMGIFSNMNRLSKYAFGERAKNKVQLYQKYMSVNDPYYLKWSLEKMLLWDQEEPAAGIVHIHGDADPVFPHRYINGCITIEGGTHIMIITKCKWFNDNLPDIIENNS